MGDEATSTTEPVNILLVDDREENLVALAAILDSPEYRLVTAQSGAEALKRLLQDEFAMVLMDVAMPGMDGFETASIIKQRERTAQIPIIFITASIPDMEHLYRGYSVGAVDYMRKPIEPHVVRAKVAAFAELYRQQRKIRRQAQVIEETARTQRELEVATLKRESEARFRNLADAVPQIVWVAEPDGGARHLNAQFVAYTGLDANPADAHGWFEAVHPDDRAGLREGFNHREPFELEIRLRGRDGIYRWHLARARPERSPDGEVIAWIGTFTDVDEQRRTLVAFDAVVDSVWIFAADDLHFLYVNKGAVAISGYTREELLALRPLDLLPEHRPVLHSLIAEAKRTGGSRTAVLKLRRKDGDTLPVELSVQYLGAERGAGRGAGRCISIVRDVSAQRAAERERMELLRRERLARRETEAARERIAFIAEVGARVSAELDPTSPTALFARASVPRWADLCLVALVDEEGEIIEAVLEPPHDGEDEAMELARLATPLLRSVMDGRAHAGEALGEPEELREHLPDGPWVCSPMRARGKVLGAMLWVRGEERGGYSPADCEMVEVLGHRLGLALENARLYAASQEAVKVRDEFLSIASHELRTPLTALQLYLQGLQRRMMRGDGELTRERILQRLAAAQRQTERLRVLVDSLLDVSRITAGRLKLERERFSLLDAAQEVAARSVEEFRRAHCTLRIHAEEAPVGLWDRMRIEQIITNLLSNAVKYSPGKPIDLTITSTDGWARLRVSDRGIGIDAAALPRIFDRFERAVSARRYGGLGLGLYITRQIVEAHGGRVYAESRRKGPGSIFTVELPLEPPAELVEGAPAQERGVEAWAGDGGELGVTEPAGAPIG